MRTIARSRGKRARSAPVTGKARIISPSASAQSASDSSDRAFASRFTMRTSGPKTSRSSASGVWRSSGYSTVTGIRFPLGKTLVAGDLDGPVARRGLDDRLEGGDAVQYLVRRDRVGLVAA